MSLDTLPLVRTDGIVGLMMIEQHKTEVIAQSPRDDKGRLQANYRIVCDCGLSRNIVGSKDFAEKLAMQHENDPEHYR